jgi:hypothetical protein
MNDDVPAHSYPIVKIERWTGRDGWWTFKVLFVLAEGTEPDPLDAEFPEIGPARVAAKAFAAAHGDCLIVEDI